MLPYRRDLRFKEIALINFWSGISRVLIVFILALMGFGYWSLVVGMVYVKLFITIAVLIVNGIPSAGFGFDMRVVKKIIRFGSSATGANILFVIFSTADEVLIGKFLGVQVLGYYTMAFYLMDMPLMKFNEIVKPVLESYFSKIRDNSEKLKTTFLNVTKAALWLIFPVLIGIALVANELVPVVFGEKWTPMVVPLIFLSAAGLFRAFTDHIPPLFLALGKPDMTFKINLAATIILPVSFYIAITNFGFNGILWAWVLVYPFISLIILMGLEKLTVITKWMYIKNLKLPIMCVIPMAISVYLVGNYFDGIVENYYLLFIKIITGILSYALFRTSYSKMIFLKLLN